MLELIIAFFQRSCWMFFDTVVGIPVLEKRSARYCALDCEVGW